VDATQRQAAERAARYAKGVCLFSGALDTPVHLELNVAARERSPRSPEGELAMAIF
jgi:hypothetical protein